jgi:hypothetical protein
MTGTARLLVVNVSLTGPERDYDTTVTFLDRRFRLVRVGTSGDVAAAEEPSGCTTGSSTPSTASSGRPPTYR